MLISENHLYFELEIMELHCNRIIHILKNNCLEDQRSLFLAFAKLDFVSFSIGYIFPQVLLFLLLHVLLGSRMLAFV